MNSEQKFPARDLFLNDPAIRFMGLSRAQQEWVNKYWPITSNPEEHPRDRSMLFNRTMENIKMMESIATSLKGNLLTYYIDGYCQFKIV